MESPVTFTGEFLKPSSAFALQHLNHADLNRLAPEIFFGVLGLAVAGLAIHFVVSTLPDLKKRRGRQ